MRQKDVTFVVTENEAGEPVKQVKYRLQSLPAMKSLSYKAKLIHQMTKFIRRLGSAGKSSQLSSLLVSKLGGVVMSPALIDKLGERLAKKLEPLKNEVYVSPESLASDAVKKGIKLTENDLVKLASVCFGNSTDTQEMLKKTLVSDLDTVTEIIEGLAEELDSPEIQSLLWDLIRHSVMHRCDLDENGEESGLLKIADGRSGGSDEALDKAFDAHPEDILNLIPEILVFNYADFIKGLKKNGRWMQLIHLLGTNTQEQGEVEF